MRGNPTEMAHFAQLAKSWWDPVGPQRILHKMNLMRLDFMRETLVNSGSLNAKKQVLDIGCGGGLLSESMARLPYVEKVTGIDITPEVLEVAKRHMHTDPLLKNKLQYKLSAVEDIKPEPKYDLVTLFEVLEHLDDPSASLKHAMSLVKPNGFLFLSTINRTLPAYLSTILMGEHILNIVPTGTHTFSKYINQSEIRDFVAKQKDWIVAKTQGCIYMPGGGWVRFDDMSRGPLRALNCAIGIEGGNYVMALYKEPN